MPKHLPSKQAEWIITDSFLEADQVHLAHQSVHAAVGFSSLPHQASESHGLLLACQLSAGINLEQNKQNGALTSAISICTDL